MVREDTEIQLRMIDLIYSIEADRNEVKAEAIEPLRECVVQTRKPDLDATTNA